MNVPWLSASCYEQCVYLGHLRAVISSVCTLVMNVFHRVNNVYKDICHYCLSESRARAGGSGSSRRDLAGADGSHDGDPAAGEGETSN